MYFFFFFQAEDGIRDHCVTGVQTCALPISRADQLVDLRIVVVAGGQPREVPDVDDRRIGVQRPGLAAALQLDARADELSTARRAGGAEGTAGRRLRRGDAVEVEAAGHPHLTELLGEALDVTTSQREVL